LTQAAATFYIYNLYDWTLIYEPEWASIGFLATICPDQREVDVIL